MKLRIEQKTVRLLGIWQVIDGIITILFYGLYKRYQYSQETNLTYENAKAMESVFGSSFIFISIFGTLLIGLGLFNLVVAKRYLKTDFVEFKWLIWLGVICVFSLIVMDIISLILAMCSLVLLMAKKKTLKKINSHEYSRSQ